MEFGLIDSPTMLLARADIAKFFQVCIGIWKSTGWSAIVYIAAIAGIEQELYEAAVVDGANRLQCAVHITIPGIMPTYLVLLLLGIGNLLKGGFEQYFVFSNVATQNTLEVLDLFTYRVGIRSQDYVFATAVSVLNSLISIVLLTFANTVAKKVRGEGIL